MPIVSVIVPVYNVEPYLRKCIDSIIKQTLEDIEIIFIDDGSTDNSFEILKEYSSRDARIIVLRQLHKGAGCARNYGLSIAEGKYLSFLDSDDFFSVNLLESAVKKAERKQADIVIYKAKQYHCVKKEYFPCDWAFCKENYPFDVFSYEDNPECIFNSFQNWAWNKLFRREFVLDSNIKFQELYRTNDLLFTCSALVSAKRIALLNKTLVYYRIGMKHNSQSTNYVAPFDFYRAFAALKEFLIKNDVYEILEVSYANHALSGCLYNLRSNAENTDIFNKLYAFLKEEGFSDLGITDFAEDKSYKLDGYGEYLKIMKSDPPDYLNYINEARPKEVFCRRCIKLIRNKGIIYGACRLKEKFMGRFVR